MEKKFCYSSVNLRVSEVVDDGWLDRPMLFHKSGTFENVDSRVHLKNDAINWFEIKDVNNVPLPVCLFPSADEASTHSDVNLTTNSPENSSTSLSDQSSMIEAQEMPAILYAYCKSEPVHPQAKEDGPYGQVTNTSLILSSKNRSNNNESTVSHQICVPSASVDQMIEVRSERNTLGQRTPPFALCNHESKIVCPKCGVNVATLGHLKKHLITHGANKRYQCSFCDCSFTRMLRLKSHLARAHGISSVPIRRVKSPKCAVVSQVSKIINPKTLVHCPDCDLAVASIGHLKIHQHSHGANKHFRCSYCSCAFSRIVKLKSHLKLAHGISSNKRATKCPKIPNYSDGSSDSKCFIPSTSECVDGSQGSKRLYLSYSECSDGPPATRRFNPQSRVICKQCGVAVASLGHLKRHLSTHGANNCYQCSRCSCSFSRKPLLIRHLMHAHGKSPVRADEEMLMIDECGDESQTPASN